MRVLITGIAGHIGSRLADWILREQPGTEVIGVDDLSCGYAENVPQGAELFRGKADDPRVVSDCGPFDAAWHFAAYAAECMSPFCRRFNYENNTVQTAGLISNLIDAGFQGRLVYASSIAAYGHGGKSPLHEHSPCIPSDPYGVAKLAGEFDLRVAGEQHGLNWCIVRPHNVYGPYQSLWQRHRNVLGLWMRAMLEGERPVIFGDGEQRRAFTYVDDVLAPLWAAGTWDAASERIINLGSARPYTVNELAAHLELAVGHSVEFRREPARHEARDAWCTVKRSEELLGYRDAVPLDDGVKRMWEWAQVAWPLYPERRAPHGVPEPETLVGMPPSWLESRPESHAGTVQAYRS